MVNESPDKVTLDRDRYDYTAHKDFRTESGRVVVDNGDGVAEIIRGMSLEGVYAVLEANGGERKPEWANLNTGMQRMSAGNVLRRLHRKLIPGGSLIVPQDALDTVTKVDQDAVRQAREQGKQERLAARREAAKAREEEQQARAKQRADAAAERVKRMEERKAERQAVKEAKAPVKAKKEPVERKDRPAKKDLKKSSKAA